MTEYLAMAVLFTVTKLVASFWRVNEQKLSHRSRTVSNQMDENGDPNSFASSDSKQTENKPVGRPRKLRHSNSEDTEPALKVAVQAVASHLAKSTSLSNPVLSLQIPNRLLLQWRSEILPSGQS